MGKKTGVFVGSVVGIWLVFAFLLTQWTLTKMQGSDRGESLVLLREVEYLTAGADGSSPAEKQIHRLYEQLGRADGDPEIRQTRMLAAAFTLGGLGMLLGVLLYFGITLLYPLHTIRQYADLLARGNFETRLTYSRNNGIGTFTWALDQMRREVLYARTNEKQAVEENKTIIAALSHDIKTPIASIRAYAEALEANIDQGYETRARYLQVLMRKCDEVTKLVNDLVLHSLTELKQIVVEREEIDIGEELMRILTDLRIPADACVQPFSHASVQADPRRLAQIMENLLNNAQKYAPGPVRITCEKTDAACQISVRDFGDGIPAKDLPFITHKFYRGGNKGEHPGSGLGLYIVAELMEKMDGSLTLVNRDQGLEAILSFPRLS